MINISRFLRLILFVTCLTISQTQGQTCIPLPVVNVTISFEDGVTWDKNPNETCEIARYWVMVDNDEGTEYIFAPTTTSLVVNFLPVCDNYVFTVIAITSQNVRSEGTSLVTKIPLPVDANLTVTSLQVRQPVNSYEVYLDWSMDADWLKCADRFRVIIHDKETDHLQDIYTFNTSISIPSMAPCTPYEFGVVAIYNLAIEGPVSLVNHDTPEAVQPAPRLSNILLGTSAVTITWNLETYARNKCPVTKAVVRVGNSYNLTLDILDQTTRQPFNVTLTDLRADSLYVTNTTVVNSAGSSIGVVLAFQTLAN